MVNVLSAEMLHGMEVKSFPAASRIFSKGDRSDVAYLVIKGDVALIMTGADGKNTALGRVGPGQIFGELAMVDEKHRLWHAVAVVETQAAVIDQAFMSSRLSRIDPFMRYWIEFMSQRLTDLTARKDTSKEKDTGREKDPGNDTEAS
jgi:CRP-like cAMP-binding protein